MAQKEKELIRKAWSQAEERAQKIWEDQLCFRATNPGDQDHDPRKEKFYCLDMFPYPSGQGLHVGHPLGYIASDILCRYKRMKNFNVLHPMGWDAFGLPAEQYAIQKGVHPRETTKNNVQTYKKQLRSLGLSYDWSREINTTHPEYYKWTQWIFQLMVKKGLAYQDEIAVNWCPELGTVLANDEVIDGKSERGGHPVIRKPMQQWMMKITDYAEKLLTDLDPIDWPHSTKELQRNWIGKSQGARIFFDLENSQEKLEVYTTRPDTLFGVSFMVLAPEHPLVRILCSKDQKEQVQDYIEESARKSDLQRGDLNKNKTGIFTGAYALHPLTQKRIPIWIADYVLMGYGSGAIMAVPAHDDRDKEFAQKYDLPILPVIDENKKTINSSFENLDFNNCTIEEAKRNITAHLEKTQRGKKETQYRLRDWIFSRQRYWGEPIPVLHNTEGKWELLNEKELPLTLPDVESYKPTGTGASPLASVKEWTRYSETHTRETNTMPGSAASSWYYLRYMDPKNSERAWSPEAENYWGQVDLYIGGAEHAVGHLLYARFWHKVLFDEGLVSHKEPFKKLIHQGLMQGEDGEKMSKSRGNVVNPDDIIAEYGSDTFRVFEMFLGPLEKAKPWQSSNIEGSFRFLIKYWKWLIDTESNELKSPLKKIEEKEWPQEIRSLFHKSIKNIGNDIERLSHNTAISHLMVLLNEALKVWKDQPPLNFVETYTKLLAPFAPHISQEIWSQLGYEKALCQENWPDFDEKMLQSESIELPIQINGKIRDRIQISPDIEEDTLKSLVLERADVQKWMQGKELKKFIHVKKRLISLVI